MSLPLSRSGVLRALGLAALCAASAFLPLSGCAGGNSTEAGNPSITFQFRRDGKAVPFTGYLRIVAAGTNPEFYYSHPDDGTTPPLVHIGFGPGFGPSSWGVPGESEYTLTYDDVSASMFERDELRLYKSAAGSLRDFNVILEPADSASSPDTLGGWLPEVHAGDRGYSTAGGDSGTTFVINLSPGHRCTGEVDTTSEAGRPLALFVPGTPYYAQVHAGRFEFVGIPAGRLPLRWVTPEGRVFAVAESLGLEGNDPTPSAYSLPAPLHAGKRLDSVSLPTPYPTLSAPYASPEGQYFFTDSVSVSLLTSNAGASIYYTLDGSTPSQDSKLYSGPIVLRSSTTLKAIAYKAGFNPSPVSANNYVLAPAMPVITPGAGQFVDSVTVTISGPAGSVIRYTVDGTTPSANSVAYAGPFTLHASALVQAIAQVNGLGSSAVVSSQYVIAADSLGLPPDHP